MDLFSDEMRRNPYPIFQQIRNESPVLHVPPPFDAWLIFDYECAKRALNDHELFSSAVPAPRNWFIFFDPPAHSRLRALISRAFTPGAIASLEPRIAELSMNLLAPVLDRGAFDLATEYSVPLPMQVIAEMIGIPSADWCRFRRWSDSILKLSYARTGGEEARLGHEEFTAVTAEMNEYLTEMIRDRRQSPRDDLLSRLVQAEVNGERLTQAEILGFFQLLVVGGQETTANLINNAILTFLEHPDEFARIRSQPALLPSAIEEVLRYRSPVQWVMRAPKRDVEMHGQTIPAGVLVLSMIGSANRDAKPFRDPERFDCTRQPNPHIAFGHGIHSCLGAALARMESRIALTHIMTHLGDLELEGSGPWEPRKALNVFGPASLPVRFQRVKR